MNCECETVFHRNDIPVKHLIDPSLAVGDNIELKGKQKQSCKLGEYSACFKNICITAEELGSDVNKIFC